MLDHSSRGNSLLSDRVRAMRIPDRLGEIEGLTDMRERVHGDMLPPSEKHVGVVLAIGEFCATDDDGTFLDRLCQMSVVPDRGEWIALVAEELDEDEAGPIATHHEIAEGRWRTRRGSEVSLRWLTRR